MPEVGVFASVVSQKVEAGEAGASGKGKCEVRGDRACVRMCVSVWFLWDQAGLELIYTCLCLLGAGTVVCATTTQTEVLVRTQN